MLSYLDISCFSYTWPAGEAPPMCPSRLISALIHLVRCCFSALGYLDPSQGGSQSLLSQVTITSSSIWITWSLSLYPLVLKSCGGESCTARLTLIDTWWQAEWVKVWTELNCVPWSLSSNVQLRLRSRSLLFWKDGFYCELLYDVSVMEWIIVRDIHSLVHPSCEMAGKSHKGELFFS